MGKILKNKIYMLIFVSDMLSNFGDIVYYMALMNYVLLIPESKLGISIISISEILPIFASFITGFFADKTKNKIRVILITLYLRVALYLILSFAMGFKASLGIVILASIINFVSDISGLYENGLYLPIMKKLVPDDEREETMAFIQSMGLILNIIFKSSGAVLISIITYQNLALFNTTTFIISAIILLLIKPKIEEKLYEAEAEKEIYLEKTKNGNKKNNLLKELFRELKESFKYLISISSIKASIIIVPILNALSTVLLALLLLIILEDKNVVIMSIPVTIALMSLTDTIGGILGGFLTMNVLKPISIMTLLKVEVIVIVCLMGAMYYHMIYLILLFAIISSILEASLNPKMGTIIFNNLPEEKLGTIMGGMATYFSTGEMISKFLFSLLVLFLSTDSIILLFMVISIMLSVYTFLFQNKETLI